MKAVVLRALPKNIFQLPSLFLLTFINFKFLITNFSVARPSYFTYTYIFLLNVLNLSSFITSQMELWSCPLRDFHNR